MPSPGTPEYAPRTDAGLPSAVEAAERARLTRAGIALAVVLLSLKAYAAWRSRSLAVLSDTLNSFLDIFSYTALDWSVRQSARAPDRDHPFGHGRAEPMAGFFISIVAILLGATILRDAVSGLLFAHEDPIWNLPTVWILLSSMAAKAAIAVLYRARGRATRSPALIASFEDSRNDVLASGIALLGFALGGRADDGAGLLIGAFILHSGVRLGMENGGHLMGKAPAQEVIDGFRATAAAVPGVLGVHDIWAHFVGVRLHVEIHVEVPAEMPIREAHDVAKAVGRAVERSPDVSRVFVHADPV